MPLSKARTSANAWSYGGLAFTALIWGLGFVAQRKGLESLDPFTFNALRFALGSLCVYLVIRLGSRNKDGDQAAEGIFLSEPTQRTLWGQPLLLGILLFIAASLQQVGMLWTGAGSAGFITGLYVVIVPLIGLLRGQQLRSYMGLAVLLAVPGLWLLNGASGLSATRGNLLVLIGAFFWAWHVQLVDKLSKEHPAMRLAAFQFAVCAVLSALGSLLWAVISPGTSALGYALPDRIGSALLPLLYAGVFSAGIAFTLQIHAQKKVKPHTASVILCLEGVFALLGGWLLLSEQVVWQSLIGAGLLLGAMLVSILGEQGRFFLIDKKDGLKR